ncbi:MAG: carbon-nitrogen hydrolase family protein [Pirellulaceae bacterium]|nr:carbon-nitrogen hydrolase family protein [Pirellulaceae bacterium]
MNTQTPVAGIQMDIKLGDNAGNVSRMIAQLDDPQVASAKLVVFPECAVSGYCFDSRDEAWPHAETIPGPATTAMLAAAKARDKHLVFGMLERSGDQLYNSCVLLGPEGVVGVYRKIHLPFLGIDRFVDRGSEPLRVYDIGSMRIGLHICYDGSFPETVRVLALLGADLIVLPTNWPPGADTFAEYLPNARALENHVYYMAVNRVGEERGFQFIGTSKFCLPSGRSPSVGSATEPSIITGSVHPHIVRNKRLVRIPGKHLIDRMADRRPEFYGLLGQPHGLVRDES